ncbi:MAG: hypothetical protein ABFS12_15540 [Bacteroidota bacterium]
MKKFRLIAASVAALAIVALFSITSCEKQTDNNSQAELSFDVVNVMQSMGKKALPSNTENLPDCNLEAVPAYVEVVLQETDVTGQIFEGDPIIVCLDILQGFEGGTQTEVLKTDEGYYQLNSFKVYAETDGEEGCDNVDEADDDNDLLIWVAPMEGSKYDLLWDDQLNGVNNPNSLELNHIIYVEKFEKHKEIIDVLCYEPYAIDDFGFTWFDFSEVVVETICFYGDICVTDHECWHNEHLVNDVNVNPYFGQSNYDGYDFPAIFQTRMTLVFKDGRTPLTIVVDNTDTQGVGEPLCVEYPMFIDGEVDYWWIDIAVMGPNGNWKPLYTDAIKLDNTTKTLWVSEDLAGTSLVDPVLWEMDGDDGVYTFVAGDLKSYCVDHAGLPTVLTADMPCDDGCVCSCP